PYGHAAPGAAACANVTVELARDGARGGLCRSPLALQAVAFGAGGEDVVGEMVDIFKRPAQEDVDDGFGNARRHVLGAFGRATGDARRVAAAPWPAGVTAQSQDVLMSMEINRDLKDARDLLRGSRAGTARISEIGVEQDLIDSVHGEDAGVALD